MAEIAPIGRFTQSDWSSDRPPRNDEQVAERAASRPAVEPTSEENPTETIEVSDAQSDYAKHRQQQAVLKALRLSLGAPGSQPQSERKNDRDQASVA